MNQNRSMDEIHLRPLPTRPSILVEFDNSVKNRDNLKSEERERRRQIFDLREVNDYIENLYKIQNENYANKLLLLDLKKGFENLKDWDMVKKVEERLKEFRNCNCWAVGRYESWW